MNSSLPLFLFWMKEQMQVFVGMDYNRGLLLLKDLVENGKAHSQTRFSRNDPLPLPIILALPPNAAPKKLGKIWNVTLPP